MSGWEIGRIVEGAGCRMKEVACWKIGGFVERALKLPTSLSLVISGWEIGRIVEGAGCRMKEVSCWKIGCRSFIFFEGALEFPTTHGEINYFWQDTPL